MARVTFPVTPAGLAAPVRIGQHGPATAARIAAGNQPVLPVQARGFIDTGTNVTAVASWVLQQLGAPTASVTSTHTVAGQVPVQLYRVSLGITDPGLPHGAPWLTVPDMLVMELTTTLPDADVLIGLDVLLDCKLLLDGPARQFTLEF
jgi:hypothetical protein